MDSTTIVEQAWTAEQRALFMEVFAEATKRQERENEEVILCDNLSMFDD